MNALSRIVLAGLVAAGSAPLTSFAADDGDASGVADRQGAPVVQSAANRGTDRLNLDTTVVTGNRELPKVMSIVPWKKAEIGDLPGQPFNTLVDEVLSPLDRDEFRREVRYFQALSSSRAGVEDVAPALPNQEP